MLHILSLNSEFKCYKAPLFEEDLFIVLFENLNILEH